MSRIRLVAAAAGVGLLASLVLTGALRFEVFRLGSDSMAPAIDAGDVVVVERADGDALRRGDVVVFDDPGGWAADVERLSGEPAAPIFVKRVIGLPGERVACCDEAGRLTVDGVRRDEPYLAEPDRLASVLAFDVVVPDASVFVLGDNRGASIDSRYLGPVPWSAVRGLARVVLDLPMSKTDAAP
ncbi:signal peptidase I [Agromyces sp. LHK192]|uniref:signal peptidase I n=1 Tax=Agromyces sp. LHK192 TaxID=2498704 RepID=UPI0013E2AE34|nr:signal peptidase I [Agromyces sp. LHK192]